MSKLHNETNINFEEVYVIKKIFYKMLERNPVIQ